MGTAFEAEMADCRSSRVDVGFVAVESMESRTAEARGVSCGCGCGWLDDGVEMGVQLVGALSGEKAFSVRERIAFWDFFVPNARPRAVRE